MTFDQRAALLRERWQALRSSPPKAAAPPAPKPRLQRAYRPRPKRPRAPRPPGQMSQGRRWQLEMKAQGRCQSCGGGPLVTSQYCDPCRLKCNARVAARRLRKGAVPDTVPQRCRVCHEAGHNAARHKVVPLVAARSQEAGT